jgi:transmembrane sensor
MQDNRIWILVSKKNSGEITEEELKELEELLAEDKNACFSKEIIDELWSTPLDVNKQATELSNIWNKVKGGMYQQQDKIPGRTVFIRRMLVAAGLLLIISTAIWQVHRVYHFYKKSAQPEINQVSTQEGSRSKIILPDGTEVWLNAGSKLTYGDFNHSPEREVNLSGEAFFKVVHDPSHPFIIHTRQIDIRDIGTCFDVKAYPEDKTVEATLISGAIEIINHNDPSRVIELKPNEKISIPVNDSSQVKPTTVTSALNSNLYTIDKVTKDRYGLLPQTAWVQNKLVFDNESFGELSTRLEKWYNIKIYFRDDSLKQLNFSGIIEKETVEEALKALQYSYPFKYKIGNNNIWISK